ncbi:hypothetical protein K7G98_21195 [Saccharothrix sp. MB29]|nr:hypothetical protein [Saccharothrix sp. MB29]
MTTRAAVIRTRFFTMNSPVMVSSSGLPARNAAAGCTTSTRNVPARCSTTSSATQRNRLPTTRATPSTTSSTPSANTNAPGSSHGTIRATRSATGVAPATLRAPNHTNTTPSDPLSRGTLNARRASARASRRDENSTIRTTSFAGGTTSTRHGTSADPLVHADGNRLGALPEL